MGRQFKHKMSLNILQKAHVVLKFLASYVALPMARSVPLFEVQMFTSMALSSKAELFDKIFG